MKAALQCGLMLLALHGQGRAEEVSINGGSTGCAVWTEARRARDSAVLEHFVLGCLNGLSLGTGREYWRANAMPITRDMVYAAMDQYCITNPGGLIVAGAIQLFNDRTRPGKLPFQ